MQRFTEGSTCETNPCVALACRLIARVMLHQQGNHQRGLWHHVDGEGNPQGVMPYGTGVDGESARIQVEK